MNTTRTPAGEHHKELREALVDAILEHTDDMSPAESLAILANVAGNVLAVQTQLNMDQAFELVFANMRNGYDQIVELILKENQQRDGSQPPV